MEPFYELFNVIKNNFNIELRLTQSPLVSQDSEVLLNQKCLTGPSYTNQQSEAPKTEPSCYETCCRAFTSFLTLGAIPVAILTLMIIIFVMSFSLTCYIEKFISYVGVDIKIIHFLHFGELIPISAFLISWIAIFCCKNRKAKACPFGVSIGFVFLFIGAEVFFLLSRRQEKMEEMGEDLKNGIEKMAELEYEQVMKVCKSFQFEEMKNCSNGLKESFKEDNNYWHECTFDTILSMLAVLDIMCFVIWWKNEPSVPV